MVAWSRASCSFCHCVSRSISLPTNASRWAIRRRAASIFRQHQSAAESSVTTKRSFPGVASAPISSSRCARYSALALSSLAPTDLASSCQAETTPGKMGVVIRTLGLTCSYRLGGCLRRGVFVLAAEPLVFVTLLALLDGFQVDLAYVRHVLPSAQGVVVGPDPDTLPPDVPAVDLDRDRACRAALDPVDES